MSNPRTSALPQRPALLLEVETPKAASVSVGLAGALLVHLLLWLVFPTIEDDTESDLLVRREAVQEMLLLLEEESEEVPQELDNRRIFTETTELPVQVPVEDTQFFGENDQAESQGQIDQAEKKDLFALPEEGVQVAVEQERTESSEPLTTPGTESRVGHSASSESDGIRSLNTDNGSAQGGSSRSSAWQNLFAAAESRERTPLGLLEDFEAVDTGDERLVQEPEKFDSESAEEILPETDPVESDESELAEALPAPKPRPVLEDLVGVGQPPVFDEPDLEPVTEIRREAVRKGIWGIYSRRMTDTIRTRFDQQIKQLPLIDRAGEAEVHFRLSKDGYVSDFEIDAVSGTDRFLNQCRAAIESSQPFGPWPEEVAAAYGDSHRVTYVFVYEESENR